MSVCVSAYIYLQCIHVIVINMTVCVHIYIHMYINTYSYMYVYIIQMVIIVGGEPEHAGAACWSLSRSLLHRSRYHLASQNDRMR